MAKKMGLKEAKASGLLPVSAKPKANTWDFCLRKQKTARQLIEFAQKHHFVITPVGYGYYVTSFNKFNCCPCAPERKACPCEEAEDEIATLGHCKCQLFWISYETYLTEKFKEE